MYRMNGIFITAAKGNIFYAVYSNFLHSGVLAGSRRGLLLTSSQGWAVMVQLELNTSPVI